MRPLVNFSRLADGNQPKFPERAPSKLRLRARLTLVADLLKENGKGDKPFRSSSSARFALLKLNNFNPRIIREPLIYLLFEFVNRVGGEHLNLVVHRTTTYKDREAISN